eukprot:ANDGO_02468.mRNA.1 Purple acid phosphatase 18
MTMARTLLVVAVLSVALVSAVLARPKVSFLKMFFDRRLDAIDSDGRVSFEEFVHFLERMDPDDYVPVLKARELFSRLDHNMDGYISWDEFAVGKDRLMNVGIDSDVPKQLHLALTSDPSAMLIIWITHTETKSPCAQYGVHSAQVSSVANASVHTYDVGHLGFHGFIYEAVMTDLLPRTKYYYRVGDCAGKEESFSEVMDFVSSPLATDKVDRVNMVVIGDQGTVAPFGFEVSNQLHRDNLKDRFDLVLLAGDIAYAGVSSQEEGEIEPIWDIYGEQIEPVASRVPWMAGVGNHESYYNFTSYKNRYQMPSAPGSVGNFWWSVRYGPVYIVHMSTEHNYARGSEQHVFLDAELKKASSDPTVHWILFAGHRPMYNSDVSEYDSHRPGCGLLLALEEMFNTYHVDFVLTGHMHCYERTYPVNNGQVLTSPGSSANLYVDPQAPVYITQGTAGAFIHETWEQPAPAWSAQRLLDYGYGKLQLFSNGTALYQYFEHSNDKLVDEFVIQKTKPRA